MKDKAEIKVKQAGVKSTGNPIKRGTKTAGKREVGKSTETGSIPKIRIKTYQQEQYTE